jgi:hypothetical protein
MAKYEIYVRNNSLIRVAQIDSYSKLDAILKFNDVGSWTLSGLNAGSDAAGELIKEQAGIIVKRNGVTLFSGPASLRSLKWDKQTNEFTISGLDDNVYLRRFLAYPVPSGPPYTSNSTDTRTGKAETVMKQFIDANIGANASHDRKINIVTDTDRGLGLTVTSSARFDQLLLLFQSIATSGGNLGFKIIQQSNNLLFVVYQPRDLSRTVIFSPLLDNLLSFEYSDTDPEANYIIAGGQGEGTSRVFYEQGDIDSINAYGRSEEFIDKRQTSDNNELIQSVQEEITNKASKSSLSISPIDTDSLAFIKDYNLGDIVSVTITKQNNDGSQEILRTFSDVVKQINLSITKDGEQINPTIGTDSSLSNPVKGIFSRIGKIDKRLGNLERV